MPYPKFEPSPEQRADVELLSAVGTSQDAIAAQVISPVTGRAINRNTLARIFAQELENGRTAIQREILAGFRKRVREEDWRAIEFGLRHFCGLNVASAGVNVNIGNQPNAEATGIQVQFITPTGKFDEVGNPTDARPIGPAEMTDARYVTHPTLIEHAPPANSPIGTPEPIPERYKPQPEPIVPPRNAKERKEALAERAKVEGFDQWSDFAKPFNPNRVWDSKTRSYR